MGRPTSLPRLVVLASTYPRWDGDHEPSFVHELSKRLVGRFDVVAIVPHAKGALRHQSMDGVDVIRYAYAPDRWETLVNDGGIVTNLRAKPWKWLLVPSFFFMQWMSARRVVNGRTVVHAHWILLPGLVARLLARPYLVTSHGSDLFALRSGPAMWMKKQALRGADEMTVVSASMVVEGARLFKKKVPTVQPMGVDLQEKFTPAVLARDIDHLLFVGRLVEKKGVDRLIEAMPKILACRPRARLSIIGHGPLLIPLQRLSSALGVSKSVFFVGPKPSSELVDWYRRASVFVAPFRAAASGDQEGLGLVLIEALGCGCPVVTTDVAAVRDVTAGIGGVVQVPADNSVLLAEAIVEVLGTPSFQRAVIKSRTALMTRFDWQVVADRYADLIEQCVHAVKK